MKFKKLESGRSMVEMLGVLAIIGVLSVGGIAGYSLSMRRHRANQIVDYVSKFALTSYSKCQKKVLDGDTDIDDCQLWTSYYADEDLQPDVGPVPSGMEAIWLEQINTSNNGVDIVNIYTKFTDKKLCQAVASIVGSACDDSAQLPIQIKQN